MKTEKDEIDWMKKRFSSTALKEAKKSTRDLMWYYNKPKEQKVFFDFGNLIELYFIDRDEFNEKCAIMPTKYWIEKALEENPKLKSVKASKTYKEYASAFHENEDNKDKYIIPDVGTDSLEVIEKISEIAIEHPMFDKIFDGMNYQDAFEWTCSKTGLSRYARTDLFNADKGIIIDIKTDAQGDFKRACTSMDYFLQAIDQCIGAVESGKMERVNKYYWFVLTKKEPYFVDFYEFNFHESLNAIESYYQILHRLKDDLIRFKDPNKIVWHGIEVNLLKVPNWY